MLELLRLITRVRIVPVTLTALLISVGWTATWPDGSMSPLLEMLLRWPMCGIGLYLTFLLVNPDYAYGLAGVLLSVALVGLAVVARLPGTEVLSSLASVHPAWHAAMLVQAAFWWSEGEDWERWTAPIR
jgi:hypothetical protein